MAYENRYEFMDGKILLYTRNGRPTYHARIKIDGLDSYVIQSTKRANLAEAKSVAEAIYNDYWYKVRNGLETGTHTFETLYRRYIEANRLVSVHKEVE